MFDAYNFLLADSKTADGCRCNAPAGDPTTNYTTYFFIDPTKDFYDNKDEYGPPQVPDTPSTDPFSSYFMRRKLRVCMEIFNHIPDALKSEYAKTTFKLSYTEGTVKPDDFKKPFKFFLKKAATVRLSESSTKLVSMFFKEVEVQTDIGLFTEELQIKGSLTIDQILIDTMDRGIGATSQAIEPAANKGAKNPPAPTVLRNLQVVKPGGGQQNQGGTKNPSFKSSPANHIEFYFYSSNNKLIFTRTYTKIVDVFASIGGISEVIGFVIIFCYAWYNGIRMEQKLLNFGILNQKKERTENQKKAKQGNDDSDWEKDRLFTFTELMKFGLMEKGCGCCCKDEKIKKRKEFYDEAMDAKDTRTDVIQIMKSVADVDSIKEALLAPYQQRLIHYLATSKKDDASNEKEMTIEEAIKELNKENKKNTVVQHQFDSYLKQNLPVGILAGKIEVQDTPDPTSEPFNERNIESAMNIPEERN
jgi:hypothetical protein